MDARIAFSFVIALHFCGASYGDGVRRLLEANNNLTICLLSPFNDPKRSHDGQTLGTFSFLPFSTTKEKSLILGRRYIFFFFQQGLFFFFFSCLVIFCRVVGSLVELCLVPDRHGSRGCWDYLRKGDSLGLDGSFRL
jgi:hypothetical protein